MMVRLFLFILLATQLADGAQRGFTAAGNSFTGKLVAVDRSWSATFSGMQPASADVLLYWGQLAENQLDATVLLSDGSSLVGSILAFSQEQVTIGSDPQTFRDSLWSRVELPSAVVRGAVYRCLPDLV